MAKHHPDAYHVYNCSGIEYDATAFDNGMTTYDWEDHHSPALVLLFEACQQMYNFLMEDEANVAVIHCNAGKGRTGTLICCYLLFTGFADNAQDAITYYGWKRFSTGKGVTQASQVRYVFYFAQALLGKAFYPQPVKLEKILI